MYNCPHCHAPTFSFWQKNTLGPGRAIECSACKGGVSVPWVRSMLCVSPIFLLGIAAHIYLRPMVGASGALLGLSIGFVVGFAISLPLYHRFAPIVKR